LQLDGGNMRLLSSRWTFFYKRIFPLIWFGFLAFCAIFVLSVGCAHGPMRVRGHWRRSSP
jgi:hypothetical protein